MAITKKYTYNDLTTNEMVKYETLSKQPDSFCISILMYPYYITFLLGLFNIVLTLAFNIDINDVLITIIKILFISYLPLLLLYLLLIIFVNLTIIKYNNKLIQKLIKERRNLKR